MNLGAWLPQVLALVPSIGVAVIGLFVNRKKRVMSELDKLIDLQDRCEPGSAAEQNIEAAIEAVSERLSETMRRRVDGAGVAAVIFVSLLALGGMYPLWLWVFRTGSWYAWIITLAFTAGSVGFIVAGFPSMRKTDEDKDKSNESSAPK